MGAFPARMTNVYLTKHANTPPFFVPVNLFSVFLSVAEMHMLFWLCWHTVRESPKRRYSGLGYGGTNLEKK
jgi:hypothetical protein